MTGTMIDEAVLEDLLGSIADDIAVPPDGARRVVEAARPRPVPAATEPAARRPFPHDRVLAVAAAVVLLGGLGAIIAVSGNGSSSKSTGGALSRDVASAPTLAPKSAARGGATAELPALPPSVGTGSTSQPPSSSSSSAPVDGAKIVKTAALDLQVPHATLPSAVSRVTAVATGLGGYVSNSQTSYGGTDPSASIALRVPVAEFNTAIARLRRLPGVKVLNDSETGTDVTAQYTNLQAQLQAATGERDALLVVLSHAQSIGDILAVRDRITAVQSEIDQLQGKINLLGDQASYSSIAVALAEKPANVKPAATHKQQTGLAKAWADARSGFTTSVEWLLARSGAALIVLLAALALAFLVRYLYPVVRRALM